MKKRIIAMFLTLMFAMSWIVSCGKDGGASDGGSSFSDKTEEVKESVSNITDKDVHLVSEDKLLHRVSIKQSDRVFVADGKTDYKILVGGSSSVIMKAASFLSNQIGACTGVYPEVVYDADGDGIIDDSGEAVNWTVDSKYLVLDCPALEKKANVKWATEEDKSINLGYSGYMMKTVGNTLFMTVNSDYGYQTVVLSFLREVLGYEWFSEDTITFSKTGATLTDIDNSVRGRRMKKFSFSPTEGSFTTRLISFRHRYMRRAIRNGIPTNGEHSKTNMYPLSFATPHTAIRMNTTLCSISR